MRDALPWAPSAEDLSPFDIYVSPKIKQRLKEKDISTMGKLMAEVSRGLCDMKNEAIFPGGTREGGFPIPPEWAF